MGTVSVDENIKQIEETIKQLAAQRNEISNEILRAEGAYRVFADMKKAGITTIEANDTINSQEVIDVQVGETK
jgi:hypothetical protein